MATMSHSIFGCLPRTFIMPSPQKLNFPRSSLLFLCAGCNPRTAPKKPQRHTKAATKGALGPLDFNEFGNCSICCSAPSLSFPTFYGPLTIRLLDISDDRRGKPFPILHCIPACGMHSDDSIQLTTDQAPRLTNWYHHISGSYPGCEDDIFCSIARCSRPTSDV